MQDELDKEQMAANENNEEEIEQGDEEGAVYELTTKGRAERRQQQADARINRKKGRIGLVIVNTGNGKGKTSAALGVLTRAWGQGMKVVMLQFLKKQTGSWGEVKAAKKMDIEVIPLGNGFTWMSQNIEQDRALAQECWQLCREKIESNQYDVVIMDEITYTFKYGWLDLQEVLATLKARNPAMHVILTGRDAPEELIEYADLVTEMREIKHPYKQGILAQKGIDF